MYGSDAMTVPTNKAPSGPDEAAEVAEKNDRDLEERLAGLRGELGEEKRKREQRNVTREFEDQGGRLSLTEGWKPEETPDGWESARLDHPNFGARRYGQECVLPLTVPRQFDGDRWIDAALASAAYKGRPLAPDTCALLAGSLAPGPDRPDGLPAYTPGGPTAGQAEAVAARGSVRARRGGTGDYDGEGGRAGGAGGRAVVREVAEHETREVPLGNGSTATFSAARFQKHERSRRSRGNPWRNQGAPIRDLLAAVARDHLGCSAFEVGTRILGAPPKGKEHDHRDPREWPGAYRAWSRGRALLAHLGCWPWAHAADGKLPREWRTDPNFIAALSDYLRSYPRGISS